MFPFPPRSLSLLTTISCPLIFHSFSSTLSPLFFSLSFSLIFLSISVLYNCFLFVITFFLVFSFVTFVNVTNCNKSQIFTMTTSEYDVFSNHFFDIHFFWLHTKIFFWINSCSLQFHLRSFITLIEWRNFCGILHLLISGQWSVNRFSKDRDEERQKRKEWKKMEKEGWKRTEADREREWNKMKKKDEKMRKEEGKGEEWLVLEILKEFKIMTSGTTSFGQKFFWPFFPSHLFSSFFPFIFLRFFLSFFFVFSFHFSSS